MCCVRNFRWQGVRSRAPSSLRKHFPCREYQKAQEGIVGLSEVNRLGVMAALYVYGAVHFFRAEFFRQVISCRAYERTTMTIYVGSSGCSHFITQGRRAYVPFVDKVFLMGKAGKECERKKPKAWLKCQELKEIAKENVKSGRFFTKRKAY